MRTLVFRLHLRDTLNARAKLGLRLAQLRERIGEVGELLDRWSGREQISFEYGDSRSVMPYLLKLFAHFR